MWIQCILTTQSIQCNGCSLTIKTWIYTVVTQAIWIQWKSQKLQLTQLEHAVTTAWLKGALPCDKFYQITLHWGI